MRFWIEVFSWFDARPQYLVMSALSGLMTVALTLLALFQPARQVTQLLGTRLLGFLAGNRFIFLFVVLMTLCTFRFPAVFFPLSLNSDEGQFIAQAITVATVPRSLPWRDYDGITSGPLDVWVLLPPHWLGIPFGYAMARGVGLLLSFGGLIAVHTTLRKLFSERTARLGILPAISFFSLNDHDYFLHYSSELLPMFLLAAAFSTLFGLLLTKHRRHLASLCSLGIAFVGGGILGLIPYSKLQAAPVAAVFAFTGLAVIWWDSHSNSSSWRRWQTMSLVVGGLLPSITLFIALRAGGELEDFWTSYVTTPIFYTRTGGAPWLTVLTIFLQPDFAAFAFPATLTTLVLAIFVAFRWRRISVERLWLLCGLLLWCAASFYVVLQPSRPITHYTLFLVLPLTALVGATLGVLLDTEISSNSPFLNPKLLGCLFVAMILLPSVTTRFCGRPNPYIGDFAAFIAWPRSAVAQAMVDAAKPSEGEAKRFAAAVWGLAPELFLESGAILGTRDAICQFQILPSPIRSYYQQRFLHDMQRNRPAVFVEAVGPTKIMYKDREEHGFETFPELAEWIAAHYEIFREVDHQRIYRWKS